MCCTPIVVTQQCHDSGISTALPAAIKPVLPLASCASFLSLHRFGFMVAAMLSTSSPDAFRTSADATPPGPWDGPITSTERDFINFVAKLSNHELGRMVQRTHAFLKSKPDASYLSQARRERLAFEGRLCSSGNDVGDLIWDCLGDLDRYIEWAWAETHKHKPATVTPITKIDVYKPSQLSRKPAQVQPQALPSPARSESMSSTTLHFRVSNYGPPTGYKSPFGSCATPNRVIEVQAPVPEQRPPSAKSSQAESPTQASDHQVSAMTPVQEDETTCETSQQTKQVAEPELAPQPAPQHTPAAVLPDKPSPGCEPTTTFLGTSMDASQDIIVESSGQVQTCRTVHSTMAQEALIPVVVQPLADATSDKDIADQTCRTVLLMMAQEAPTQVTPFADETSDADIADQYLMERSGPDKLDDSEPAPDAQDRPPDAVQAVRRCRATQGIAKWGERCWVCVAHPLL